MASAGTVLPFVRGIDLTRNDFQVDGLPSTLKEMTGLRWFKANNTKLSFISEELGPLQKLEHLSLKNNNLDSFAKEPHSLVCLRSLNLRNNLISHNGLPSDLFRLEELTTIDLSNNNLSQTPIGLDNAKSLLVLNMANNFIEEFPTHVFINCTDLLYLNLGNNKLETFPPQIRRLVLLRTLILNNNPLTHFQFRQLPSLVSLETLHLRNTQRSPSNLPSNLDSLTHLVELDLSQNKLGAIPDCVYTLKALKRLNISDNAIEKIESDISSWSKIQMLNVCRNKLTVLPPQLCKLEHLRSLFLNENRLNFEGIPSGVGKLAKLEIFSAAHNELEMIPEGLCRCPNLKKLILNNNKLVTLPEAIHFITESLELLRLDDNEELMWPPKPRGLAQGSGITFYNIDFSLQTQLRNAGAQASNRSSELALEQASPSKDPIARKKRLRQFRKDQDDKQEKILKGMKDIAKDEEKQRQKDKMTEERFKGIHKNKRWDEALERPSLNYAEFFSPDVGQIPGLTIWEIENFLPNQIEEAAFGKFYEGDCYIVLNTRIDASRNLDWNIFFWIGEKSTLDKKACSAIHAVNLRNYLGAQSRTHREEQGDESEEFLALFHHDITYIEGGRTPSGFYTVEEIEYPQRMYRIHSIQGSVHLEAVGCIPSSLDSRHVYLVDANKELFLWQGHSAKRTLFTKARLIAEKINKDEKKNLATIFCFFQGQENPDWDKFWVSLGLEDGCEPKEGIQDNVSEDFVPIVCKLYKVGLGMGYLELPQVEVPQIKLTQSLLNTKNVYILDCFSDIFVWIGKKSTRLVRAAALKLSQELVRMVNRPKHAATTLVKEGTEPLVFKHKFYGWTDVIQVDYTRTAESVRKTGANLREWARNQETKVELSALFTPRQAPMSLSEALQCIEEWNADLDSMDAFVLEGKKFGKLPETEIGHFYSAECYVFLCRYWVPHEDFSDEEKECDSELQDDFQCIVYFWQGREASNMGWLTFTFSLQKRFEALFGDKLEVVRMHQQQEAVKFMAHFRRKFIIHHGKRKAYLLKTGLQIPQPQPELFHIRSNGSPLFTRCIQIKPDSSNLNSEFCFIFKVPFGQEEDSGIVYIWIGEKSDADESRLAEDIAQQMYNSQNYSLQVIREGEEPENFFWIGIGGRKIYDKCAHYMRYARLFRCSNEKGYFAISEKCSDFCQDDLADDDTMILDDGAHVFLWLGSKASEVEIKLALKSAQVYVQNLRLVEPESPRKLLCTLKGKESKKFQRCFHGWGEFTKPPE